MKGKDLLNHYDDVYSQGLLNIPVKLLTKLVDTKYKSYDFVHIKLDLTQMSMATFVVRKLRGGILVNQNNN